MIFQPERTTLILSIYREVMGRTQATGVPPQVLILLLGLTFSLVRLFGGGAGSWRPRWLSEQETFGKVLVEMLSLGPLPAGPLNIGFQGRALTRDDPGIEPAHTARPAHPAHSAQTL
ncbi:unnamed protein product [Boreogadus saida]